MRKLTGTRNQSEGDLLTGSEALPLVRWRQLREDGEYKEEALDAEEFHALYVVVRRRHESRHGRHEIVVISHLRHEKVIVIGICKAILYSLFYLVFWFD